MADKTPKGGGVLAFLAIAKVTEPILDKIEKKIKDAVEERKDWVTIPELCSKSMLMRLDPTKKALENLGLEVMVSVIDIKKANVRYKDCVNLQIVNSNFTHKCRVPPRTLVILECITSEVIEESQRLFDESEERKAEIKNGRRGKRIEQKQKTKKLLNNAVKIISKKKVNLHIRQGKTLTNSKKKTACEVDGND